MQKHKCDKCGWIYDPEQGFPVFGIEAGTKFEDLPDHFRCPVCSAGKDKFSPVED